MKRTEYTHPPFSNSLTNQTMKSKFSLLKAIRITFIVIICSALWACPPDSKQTDSSSSAGQQNAPNEILPLNVSIYLDLSDRLTRDLTPTQMERDTAIINHLIDVFIKDCVNNGKIINSQNHFQVFFYPTPKTSEIAQLARGLNVDLSKCELKQKKVELMDMKNRFQTNLAQIYNDAINEQKWVGSDIWGFFNNKEVDKLCIRNGYRNILVILTDGYLYHADNKIKDGNSFSYVLPKTLEIPESSLIAKRDGLSDLEILMLEVNPYTPKQHDALITVLENWFRKMGVGKFVVSETALPVTTEIYIDSFITE